MFLDEQEGEELAYFRGTHLDRMAFVVEEDASLDPTDVSSPWCGYYGV